MTLGTSLPPLSLSPGFSICKVSALLALPSGCWAESGGESGSGGGSAMTSSAFKENLKNPDRSYYLSATSCLFSELQGRLRAAGLLHPLSGNTGLYGDWRESLRPAGHASPAPGRLGGQGVGELGADKLCPCPRSRLIEGRAGGQADWPGRQG